MTPDHMIALTLIVAVGATCVALAFNDSPFLAFFLALLVLGSVKVSA